MEPKSLHQHIVILGWNKFSEMITQELLNAKQQVAIVTQEEDALDAIDEEFQDRPVVAINRQLTNYKALSDVRIEDAIRVFVNLASDEDSLVAILNMKKQYDDLDYVVVLDNDELEETFQTAGVSYVISRASIASKIVTSYLYEEDVAVLESDLLEATENKEDVDIQQYRVTRENPYVDRSYKDLFWELKTEHNVIPIGLSKEATSDEQGRELQKVPSGDTMIEVGDYVLLVLNSRSETAVEELFGVTEGI